MIRDLTQAKHIQYMIDKLGVKDVILMYDKQINMWSVCQVRKKPKMILTMDAPNMIETEATLMFWIKNNDGTYRTPNDEDIRNVIAIITRAQVWFDKGSDKMIDEIEKQEKEKYDKNRQAQSEKIRSYAPSMKKYIKKELL